MSAIGTTIMEKYGILEVISLSFSVDLSLATLNFVEEVVWRNVSEFSR